MLWQPSASIDSLKARANFLANIRQFFAQKGVLEVETPLLSRATVTDVHLDAFDTEFEHDVCGETVSLYLQTSPEYAMKRLLASGIGAIYQISKAFRNESAGRHHNPEFTMLEWYRPGFDDRQLMAEVDDLVQSLLGTQRALRLSYQQAFIQHTSIDPLVASRQQLINFITKHSSDKWLLNEPLDTLLQWIFSFFVEPNLGDENTPCLVYDFPASQASLAKINASDPRVAHRFELYFKGIELANGFYELQDAKEQRKRFDRDNQTRKKLGLKTKPIDEHLLAALEYGLPDCAGVALGVDRLFMIQQGKSQISDVLSFSVDRA